MASWSEVGTDIWKVRALLELRADPTAVDNDGCVPADLVTT